MRQLVQNTNSLSIGKLSQNQIKIGSGSGSNIGIYFNNGNENLPGIRFLNSNEPVKEWQYSNDGSNWFSIKPGKSSIDLSYELISITSSDLVDGIATIKHNLGQKYILGLDYTITPDNIEYTDENTLKLDYSNHENLNCKVWFYKSNQDMLQAAVDESTYTGNLDFVAGEGWPTGCSNECCSVDDFRSSSSNQNSYYEIADNSKSGIERVWHLYNNCDGANHRYYNEIYYNKEKLRWELSDGCCTDGGTPNWLYAYTNADADISQAKSPWEYEWNFNNENGTITSDIKSSIIKVES